MSETDTFTWRPGHLLGDRYELTARAGAGGAAEVWRARDRRLGRDVAVKLLSGPAAADPTHRHRIEREARALASLAHRNIVQVFDYGEDHNVPYLVMEYVDGPDLAKHLATNGPLDVPDAVGLLAQTLRGVAQAHAIGIVHGDLKPGNVLLAATDAGWEPKVGDFGVARVRAEETGTTVPVATPAYAPPEVLQGERPTAASDVYSAACIAFEVLTGERPFRGRTIWEATKQHMSDPPPSLRDNMPAVPEAIDEVVRRALSKHPSGRYQSAEAFAAALEAGIAQAPASALPLEDTAPMSGDEPPKTTVLAGRHPTETLPPRPKVRRRSWVRLAALPVGPSIAAVSVLLLLALRGTPTASAPVPLLVGSEFVAAEKTADRNGFTLRRVDVDGGGRKGTVVAQSPAPGTVRPKGTEIRAEVTKGVPQVEIPDVTGKPLQEAMNILAQAGFTTEQAFVLDARVPPNTVIRTIPAAGTSVDQGSGLALIVAAPTEEKNRGKGKERKDDD